MRPILTRHTRSACQNSGFQQSSESGTCSHPDTASKERETGYFRHDNITTMRKKLHNKCEVVGANKHKESSLICLSFKHTMMHVNHTKLQKI